MKTKQKTLLALLVFALCAALFAVMTFTASAADVTLSGSGTRNDPYIVTSQEELVAATSTSANVSVKLGKSFGVTSEFAFTSNILYLDLNSYRLTVYPENGIVVQETSALYIFDTAGGGTINNNHNADGWYHAITNHGTLYIENNVTIEVYTHGNCALKNYGTATIRDGKITAHIYNEGTLNIEGGEISQTIDNHGTVNISGGTVTTSSICINNYAKLSITGGSLSSTTPVGNPAGAEMTVTGGTITGEWYGISNGGTLTISGGTITGEWYGVNNVGTLAISGGTLIKGIDNNSVPVKQCLAGGYAFFDESGNPIVLNAGQTELTGNVTIGKCTTHMSDNASCTVQTDCGACGIPYIDPTAHNFDETNVCACGAVKISEKTFPDEKFRAYISANLDKDGDGTLSAEEIAAVSSINVSGKEIVSLAGIKYFTALTELRCYNNQLTSLDVSTCTALDYLDCYGNQLTSLDVSKNTELTYLSCYSNQLASLDISGCSALTYLDCFKNQLTSLDVSTCSALDYLDCYGNQLTSLDVSKNTELTYLNCYNNKLTSLDVSTCSALTTLNCYNNQLTSLDVSTCTALTDLVCYINQLASLDVSTCTALTDLVCSDNQLASLDVSGCSALEKLYCYYNALTSLDVSTCTALEILYCYSNQLTSLDLSNNASLLAKGITPQILYITEDDAKNYTVPAGFDASKATNVTGGVFNGNVLDFNESAKTVKYTYETGLEGITMDVTIYIHEHDFNSNHVCIKCGLKKAEASQVSVTLDGDIGVNFYWTLQSEVISDTSAYFLVTLPCGNTERFDVSAMTPVEKDGALYYRVTGRVAAKEMADDVVVELYAGGELIASANCSVRGYAARAFKYSNDAELIAMMKAMLNYGAASQMLFGHNTSDLANSILADDEKNAAVVNEADVSPVVKTGSVSGITPTNFSCILETKTTIRHYFTVDSGSIEGYTFKVGNTTVEPTLVSGNTYYVDIENISATDLGTAYTFTITDGTTTQTITASVESYMNSVIVNKDNENLVSPELLATVYAMHAYGTSAETYFN